MTEWNLLVVEDDEANFSMLEDAVEGFDEMSFNIIKADTLEEATSELENRNIDCGIIDLRMPEHDGDQPLSENGVKVILSAIQDHGIPVVLFSGWPHEAGDSLDDFPMLAKLSKSEDNAQYNALKWLSDNKYLISAVRNSKRLIKRHTSEMFAKRILPMWDTEAIKSLPEDIVCKIISRQIASHTSEQLGIEHPDNVAWHPAETYIIPPFREGSSHTGDIFDFGEDGLWIVLTPQCDMATGSVDNILIAKCDQADIAQWETHLDGLKDETKTDEKRRKHRDFITNCINQAVPVSNHFLPPLLNYGPITVKYKQSKTVPLEHLISHLDKRIASLASPFVSNLTQRFGAYISRPGQPNIDPNYL